MIGIDIGGANLKVVDDSGTHIHYCPLWEKAPIAETLRPYATSAADPAAVVMSGELADCFHNKHEGISFIVNAVKQVFPRARFYGIDAAFHTSAVPELAAANWLASADFLRRRFPDSLLLDIGSTTTDIIPLNQFGDLKGLTDTRRLQKGYLIYCGMLRTSIPTLIQSVEIEGIRTPVSTEFFATSADAHLVLGHIGLGQYTCDTADRKEKTRDASLRRLARVVCADIEEIGSDGALAIAHRFWETQRSLICSQVDTVARSCGTQKIILAGIGAALFARELPGTDLTTLLGSAADALPAHAVRELAPE